MNSFNAHQSFGAEDLVSLEGALSNSDPLSPVIQPRAIANYDPQERPQQSNAIETSNDIPLTAVENAPESQELYPLSPQLSDLASQDLASNTLSRHTDREKLEAIDPISTSSESEKVLESAHLTQLSRQEQGISLGHTNDRRARERPLAEGCYGSAMDIGQRSNSILNVYRETRPISAFEARELKGEEEVTSDLAYDSRRSKASTYCYSPLPPGEDIIRLLRLMPARDMAAALHCELFHYSLKSGQGTHLYEALSYVWGDPIKTKTIFVGEESLNVTSNLHSALLHLRNHVMERILWIDAICINQGNTEEKENQIQYMAKIYDQAKCVVVWLGEDADDGQQALEDIRAAAEDESPIICPDTLFPGPSREESSYTMDSIPQEEFEDIHKAKRLVALFYRPWFQRVWVLQEVASARQVVILCGEAELDGYVFCTGLRGLKFPGSTYPGLQGIVRSVTYLMRGAIFRPRSGARTTSRVSLGTLIDMYHTRKATIPHDKVYALLGMSSDDYSIHGLSPNYALPWKNLMQQLIQYILGDAVFVDVLHEKEIAVIKSRGCVIGRVAYVAANERYDRQQVQITFSHTSVSSECRIRWGEQWTLQASAKSIETDDIVCLLEGATRPTIIRLSEAGFNIILITAIPVQSGPSMGTIEPGWFSAMPKLYERTFRLMWIWERDMNCLEQDDRVTNYFRDAHKEPTALYDKILILRDSEHYTNARECLQWILTNTNIDDTSGDRENFQLMDKQLDALMHAQTGAWDVAEQILLQVVEKQQELYGRDHPAILDSKAHLVPIFLRYPSYRWQMKELKVEELARQVREIGTTTPQQLFGVIEWSSSKLLALLLGLRRGEVPTTRELVKAVLRHKAEASEDMLKVLFDQRGTEIHFTEELLIDVVKHRSGKEIMDLLFQRGEEVHITENVVKAAAGDYHYSKMKLLLDQRGDEIKVTADVMKVMMGSSEGLAMLRLFPKRMVADIAVTEELVKTALPQRYGRERIQQLHDFGCTIAPMANGVLELIAASGEPSLLPFLHAWTGTDVVPQQLEHITQLWEAADLGDTKTFLRLIEPDNHLDKRDPCGGTLLHRAVGANCIDIARILLEKDTVDVNARDDYNRTPLSCTTALGNPKMARLLLDHGARQEDVDSFGLSPLASANIHGYTEVAALLHEYNTGGPEERIYES